MAGARATGDMAGLATAVRREAFRLLRGGRPGDPAQIAAAADRGEAEVRRALADLAGAGRVELDEEGRVVGAAGLSLLPTRHRLSLGGVQLHTWCAIDALGIPAALGEDALVQTTCPRCGETIEVSFRGGRVYGELEVVAWLPSLQCSNVREEFCPEANAFCDRRHLEAWRASAGDPPGRPLDMREVQAIGRVWWGDLR